MHPWTGADSVRAERSLRREKHRGRSHKPSVEHAPEALGARGISGTQCLQKMLGRRGAVVHSRDCQQLLLHEALIESHTTATALPHLSSTKRQLRSYLATANTEPTPRPLTLIIKISSVSFSKRAKAAEKELLRYNLELILSGESEGTWYPQQNTENFSRINIIIM